MPEEPNYQTWWEALTGLFDKDRWGDPNKPPESEDEDEDTDREKRHDDEDERWAAR